MNPPTVKETGRTLAPVIIIFAFAILMTIVVTSLTETKGKGTLSDENGVLLDGTTDGSKVNSGTRKKTASKDVPDFSSAIREAEKYVSEGKKYEAETVYRTLLIYYGDEPALMNAFASFLCKTGKYDEAEYYFRRLDAAIPDNAVTVNNIAITCVRQKKYLEAEKLFEKASSLAPDFAAPEMNLASMYSETGKTEEAEKHFSLACERLKKRVFAKKDASGVLVSSDGDAGKTISERKQDK